MSAVFAPTDAIYALFRSLASQALEQHPDVPGPLAVGAYDYRPAEGAFLLHLYPERNRSAYEVGYLPKAIREQKGAIAHFAAANDRHPRLFRPSSVEAVRDYLKTLLFACEHDREGLVEFKVPEGDVLPLEPRNSVSTHARSPRAADTMATAAVRISFEALAQEISTGRAQPFEPGSAQPDQFEVWASRTDPVALVIIRHFDAGAAHALAALAPEGMHAPLAFDEATYLLFQSLTAPRANTPAAPVFGALRLLEGAEVAERLTAALQALDADEVKTYEPGLIGQPSAQTLAYVHGFVHLAPAAFEIDEAPEFERIARLRIKAARQYAWSSTKEARRQSRIEFLEHRDFRGGFVLAQIEPQHPELYVAVFCPVEWDEARHDEFLAAVRELGISRQFGTEQPIPLEATSRFKHVDADRTVTVLGDFLASADAYPGCYHDMEALDFAATTPLDRETMAATAPHMSTEEFFTITQRPEGTALH